MSFLSSLVGAIPIVGDVVNGIQGASAAKKASAAQVDAANKAGALVSSAADKAGAGVTSATQAAQAGMTAAVPQANALLQGVYDASTGALKPYQQAGSNAIDLLNAGVSAGGEFSNPFNFEADPGYAFRLSEGMKQLNSSAAARGGLLSGRAVKEGMKYNSGLAAQEYGNASDRFQSNRQQRFSMLSGLAGFGQAANGQQIQAGSQFVAPQASNLLTGAEYSGNAGVRGAEDAGNFGTWGAKESGDYLTQAGNARASGYMGASKAYSGMITGASNALTDMATGSKWYKKATA